MGPLPAAAAAPAQRHRMPPQRGAQRAARRTVAALAALVAFLAVLAVVPLATAEPAEAHDLCYWKTVRTCIVDPPINHCTTERVRLPAHHSHPPPPTTQPKQCPDGQTGTPPNCTEPNKNGKGSGGSGGTTATTRKQPSAPTDPKACTYIDIVAFGGVPHAHDGLGCHDSVPGHQHSGAIAPDPGTPPSDGGGVTEAVLRAAGLVRVGTVAALKQARGIIEKIAEDNGEAALQKAEITAEFGRELQRLWDKTPLPVKAFIAGASSSLLCSGLVAVAVKTTVATGGAAAPAWVGWASTGGGAVCGGAVAAAVAVVGSGDDSSTDDDGGDGTEEDAGPEPTPGPKPTAAEIKQKNDELYEAHRRHRNGEITAAEMREAFRRWARWRCEEMGHTGWCNR